jgi:uncharacterized protein
MLNIDWPAVIPWLAHLLLILTTLIGVVGSFVPALPGAVIIWAGAILHGLMTGWSPLGLKAQLIIGALALAAAAGQLLISAAGAKRFGSSNWGIFGAGIGLLVGTFAIPVPVAGSLVGAFLGALVFELTIGQKKRQEQPQEDLEPGEQKIPRAARAGAGAALGAVGGMMAEVGFALVMAVVVVGAFVV